MKTGSVKWCCVGFQNLYQAAGERTFAILVGRDPLGAPEFTLHHRALSRGQTLPTTGDVPISLVSDLRIRFCPWCGRRLDRQYRKHVDALWRPGLKVEYTQPTTDGQ